MVDREQSLLCCSEVWPLSFQFRLAYIRTPMWRPSKGRHLLSHTGGTGDIFGPKFEAHRLELKTLQDYVKLYGERDLQFDPGTRWEYSNSGFLLLGMLIEKLSGKS